MSIQIQEKFIKTIKEVESELADIGFSHLSTTKKGYATYVRYKSADNTQVSFMFGPSDWEVELSVIKNGVKYEFKDLLQIPSISQWTGENKLQQQTGDRIKDEVSWFVDLLRFVIKTQPLTN